MIPAPAHAHLPPRWIAPALTFGAPLAILFAEQALPLPSDPSVAFAVRGVLPLLGIGAGQVYAGAPLKALIFSLGGPIVGIGSFALFERALAPHGGNGGAGLYVIESLTAGAVLAYAGGVAWDAYASTSNPAIPASTLPSPAMKSFSSSVSP